MVEEKLHPVLQQYLDEAEKNISTHSQQLEQTHSFSLKKTVNPKNIVAFLYHNNPIKVLSSAGVLFTVMATVWMLQLLPLWADGILFLTGLLTAFAMTILVEEKIDRKSIQEVFQGTEYFLKKQSNSLQVNIEDNHESISIDILSKKKNVSVQKIELEKNKFTADEVASFALQLEEIIDNQKGQYNTEVSEIDIINSSLSNISKKELHPYLNQNNKHFIFHNFDVEKTKTSSPKALSLHALIFKGVNFYIGMLIIASLGLGMLGGAMRINDATKSPYTQHEKIHAIIKDHSFKNSDYKELFQIIQANKLQGEQTEFLKDINTSEEIKYDDKGQTSSKTFFVKYVLKNGKDKKYKYELNREGELISAKEIARN